MVGISEPFSTYTHQRSDIRLQAYSKASKFQTLRNSIQIRSLSSMIYAMVEAPLQVSLKNYDKEVSQEDSVYTLRTAFSQKAQVTSAPAYAGISLTFSRPTLCAVYMRTISLNGMPSKRSLAPTVLKNALTPNPYRSIVAE